MFSNMGYATKLFVISVLGYQFLSNCGIRGIEDCNKKLDMVIVVDSSFSVRLANFIRVKEFIKSLIGHLPVQSDRIRVSVVKYSTQVHVISYLNNQTSKSEKIAAVESMKYRYGATHTGNALNLIRTVVLTPERGDRLDVPNLVIMMTDGASQNESLTTEEAMALKTDDNLKMFVIGIGSEVVDRELESMASRPEMVYKLTNFTQLTQILETVVRFSCSDMKEDSISELLIWSNSNNGFTETSATDSSASKTSSLSQHPSTASNTPSQHPSTASNTPSQHPSTASNTPSHHPTASSSTPSQCHSMASSTPSFNGIIYTITASLNGINYTITASFDGIMHTITTSFNGITHTITASFNDSIYTSTSSINGISYTITASINGIIYTITASFKGIFHTTTASFNGIIYTVTTTFNGIIQTLVHYLH